MANFSADSTALSKQADLHQRIAQYYRTLHDQLQGPTSSIISALSATGYNNNDAFAYRQFVTQDTLAAILAEARSHDDWAAYFTALSQRVSGLEDILSATEQPAHGRNRPLPS